MKPSAQVPSLRVRTPSVIRLLAGAGMVVLLVAGIFFWGRVASDDRAATLLTALWFGVVFIGGFLATRRRRDLRVSLAVGYALVAVGTVVLIGLPMFRTDEVSERVVTGALARDGGSSRNLELARGRFVALSHPGSGTAAVVELPGGRRKLTLTEFETDNGPDLRVYLSTEDPAQGGELGDFEDLGALRGNVGDQQYDIPMNVSLDRFHNVVIWCRAFSVGFTSASLESS